MDPDETPLDEGAEPNPSQNETPQTDPVESPQGDVDGNASNSAPLTYRVIDPDTGDPIELSAEEVQHHYERSRRSAMQPNPPPQRDPDPKPTDEKPRDFITDWEEERQANRKFREQFEAERAERHAVELDGRINTAAEQLLDQVIPNLGSVKAIAKKDVADAVVAEVKAAVMDEVKAMRAANRNWNPSRDEIKAYAAKITNIVCRPLSKALGGQSATDKSAARAQVRAQVTPVRGGTKPSGAPDKKERKPVTAGSILDDINNWGKEKGFD